MTPFRLAVYDMSHKLLGYWWLREHAGGYALTMRHPITREFELHTAETPQDIVKIFYKLYTQYLAALVAQLENALKELPQTEVPRPGFRAGWLVKTRRELVSRRAEVMCRSRERYAEAVTTLRSNGWPSVPPLPLPWDTMGFHHAQRTNHSAAEFSRAV